MQLPSKVALVTGASQGLGWEIAQAFAREGAVIALLSNQGAEERAAELRSAGHKALALTCDVGNSVEYRNAVNLTLETFGVIDILVNNAAIAIPGDIVDQTDAEWLETLNVNLLGVFRGIKFVLPGMLERKSGSIISIASLQGERSWDHWTTYAAAKGGVKAMTRQLAGQYGSSGVRFNTISPGAMNTPMNQARREREGDEFYEASCRLHALGRMGRADEINGAAIYLASDASSFVTGSDLVVDGGLSVLSRA